VWSFHWPPEKIESLYLDDMDFRGLYYWYNEIKNEGKEEPEDEENGS